MVIDWFRQAKLKDMFHIGAFSLMMLFFWSAGRSCLIYYSHRAESTIHSPRLISSPRFLKSELLLLILFRLISFSWFKRHDNSGRDDGYQTTQLVSMQLLRLIQLLGLTARSPVMLDARQAVEFSNYVGCAQDCLQSNAENTNCLSYSTLDEQSACLCVDSPFIAASAQCIYSSCAYSIFEISASTIISNCQTTNTPSTFTLQEIINAGEAGMCLIMSSGSRS
jgi:hypothetical protein